jgi:hypothetical protein
LRPRAPRPGRRLHAHTRRPARSCPTESVDRGARAAPRAGRVGPGCRRPTSRRWSARCTSPCPRRAWRKQVQTPAPLSPWRPQLIPQLRCLQRVHCHRRRSRRAPGFAAPWRHPCWYRDRLPTRTWRGRRGRRGATRRLLDAHLRHDRASTSDARRGRDNARAWTRRRITRGRQRRGVPRPPAADAQRRSVAVAVAFSRAAAALDAPLDEGRARSDAETRQWCGLALLADCCAASAGVASATSS